MALLEVAQEARARGLRYLAITDTSALPKLSPGFRPMTSAAKSRRTTESTSPSRTSASYVVWRRISERMARRMFPGISFRSWIL